MCKILQHRVACNSFHINILLLYYIYSARLRLSIGNLVGVVNYTDLVVLGSFIIHNRRMTFNLSFIIVLQQIERIQIMAKCPWALTVTWVYFHRKNIYFEYPYERVHFQGNLICMDKKNHQKHVYISFRWQIIEIISQCMKQSIDQDIEKLRRLNKISL